MWPATPRIVVGRAIVRVHDEMCLGMLSVAYR